MFWLAPNPRFRIYTRLSDYAHLLRDFAVGALNRGDDCERLEREVAGRMGMPYAICMPQARLGIYLLVKAYVTPTRKKIVLSPYTIADVINMVICAGGEPVFADIDRPTTNVSASEIEKLVDEQTAAVMVTHLHGIPCEIERIAAFCASRGVPLLEDTAQAFGARGGGPSGKMLGSWGAGGILSFGMYKNVTGFYGGMIVLRDEAVHRKIREEMKSWPYMPARILFGKIRQAAFTDFSTWPPVFRSAVYWIFRFGFLHDVRAINKMVTIELDTSRKKTLPDVYRARMRPFQARMILRQLPKLDEYTKTRLAYSRIYFEGLKGLPGLIIPPMREDGTHIYNYFPVQFADRQKLLKWMMLKRRDAAGQHLKNCAGIESFKPEARPCPNAEATSKEVILLPNYPAYGEKQVRANVAAIREFFTKP